MLKHEMVYSRIHTTEHHATYSQLRHASSCTNVFIRTLVRERSWINRTGLQLTRCNTNGQEHRTNDVSDVNLSHIIFFVSGLYAVTLLVGRQEGHSACKKHGVGLLHCMLSLVAQCIVIGPVCGFVCVCVCLCVGLLPR